MSEEQTPPPESESKSAAGKPDEAAAAGSALPPGAASHDDSAEEKADDSGHDSAEDHAEDHAGDPTSDSTGDSTGDPTEELNTFHLQAPKLKELIHSPDSPSRYLTWLSLAFAGMALICFGLLAARYLEYRRNNRDLEAEKAEEARLYGGWLNKQLAFNRARPGEEPVFMQSLGEFRVLWPGNELRVNMTAECTNEETCNGLKDQPDRVHDLLLPILQASSAEEVLNPNRKLELRRLIAEKLNTLKFSGKIMMVDFTNLTVEPAPAGAAENTRDAAPSPAPADASAAPASSTEPERK